MSDTTDTPETLPFCALSGDELAIRRGEFRALMARRRGRVRWRSEGLELAFANGPGLGDALRDLAAKERQCCGSLNFSVVETESDVAIRVTGPAEDLEGLATTLQESAT